MLPRGRFRYPDTLTLDSDIELALAHDAEPIFTNSATHNAITAMGKSRIIFSRVRLTGSGAAGRSTVNSGFAGFRKGGQVTSVVELADKDWDKVQTN